MTRLMTLVAGLALVGCGGGSSSSGGAGQPTAGANPCGAANPCGDSHDFNPCGATAGEVDCSDWQSWTKVSAEPFESKGHRKEWVDVYVDPAFADQYRNPSGQMPVGMRVIKVAYEDAGGSPGAPNGLTVMAKMEAGYDPEHGDWYYGVYDPTGTKAMNEGKISMCIDCHADAEDTDYLFGLPE